MGYTHLTDIGQFVSPFLFTKSSGTWTPTVASNTVLDLKTAASETVVMTCPVMLFGSTVGTQGARLKSIRLWYGVATAALTSFNTVAVLNQLLGADGAVSGAAFASTIDSNHDSSAKRVTVASHCMTITPDVPVFIRKNRTFWLHLSFVAAATSVFSNYGAYLDFDLRI